MGMIGVDRRVSANEENATVFLTLQTFCQVYRREADGVMRKAGDITRRYIITKTKGETPRKNDVE
jgi:hypothetical protein